MHLEYYSEADLTIGTVLNVWGRKLLLCDCDGYTREFYRTKYGIGEGREQGGEHYLTYTYLTGSTI